MQMNRALVGKKSTKKMKLMNQIKANNQLMRNNGDLSHLNDSAITTHYLPSNGSTTTTYGSSSFAAGAPTGLKTLKKDASGAMSSTKFKNAFNS
jgi:hypothetical protein